MMDLETPVMVMIALQGCPWNLSEAVTTGHGELDCNTFPAVCRLYTSRNVQL